MTAGRVISDARTALAERLGAFLLSAFDAQPLSASDLRAYEGKKVDRGWRIPGDPSLHLLLDPEFPYAPPRIALPDDTRRLLWPHVETAGILCVFPAQTNIDAFDPERVADALIADARDLIARNQSGDLDEAFRQEFQSYWILAVDDNAPYYRSLVTPRGPTRKIRVWRGQKKSKLIRIFGDTDESLSVWLNNAHGSPPKNGWRFYDALLIWLERPLTPAEYPNSACDIEALLSASTPSADDILPVLDISQSADVLIGAPAEVGTCFGAVHLDKPDEKAVQKGFRPGHAPAAHVKRHATSPARKARKGMVERVDSSWVHGRDHNEDIERLADTNIVVIGCGALGASVAVLLAQAGVGRLRLFDGETLDHPNTSRHPLGARQIGENKANALAEHISGWFPHMRKIEAVPEDLAAANIDIYADISDADLVVSATGEWSSMSLIADAASSWRTPLQTVWQEPQALAAHSVVTFPNGPCLRCGFDPLGNPHFEAILQNEADIWRQIPTCGGAFTPYGATDLAFTSGFCAAESLTILSAAPVRARHAIWAASKARLDQADGRYTDDFIAAFNPTAQGGAFIRDWPESASCRFCAG
jgi:molybdopterin/thiamine biosynthesis adenylyltransferase